MSLTLNNVARLALIALSGLGTLAGVRLTFEHLPHGGVCPMLGPVPACIVVFLGYLLILLSAIFLTKSASKKLFYVGWTPVFLLALMGVIVEIGVMLGLIKDHICPPGALGIPQCFFSFAMVLICLVLFKVSRTALDTA